jgi:surface protein
MFAHAKSFNQPILTWDTSAVTSMNYMFYYASAFNQPIGVWNTSNVKDMEGMFLHSASFNQPIGSWNTGAVTRMDGMFAYATAFNQPIGSWNTGAVTNMNFMFQNAEAFNQPLHLWQTNNVRFMDGMFAYAKAFSMHITFWSTVALQSASQMFACANAWLSIYRRIAVGASGSDGPPSAWYYHGNVQSWELSSPLCVEQSPSSSKGLSPAIIAVIVVVVVVVVAGSVLLCFYRWSRNNVSCVVGYPMEEPEIKSRMAARLAAHREFLERQQKMYLATKRETPNVSRLAVAVEAEYAKQRLDAKRAAKALRISERESRRQRDVELGDPVDASEETEDASNEASPP